MLKYFRGKMQSKNRRSGGGGGLFVTPDLSYNWEGEKKKGNKWEGNENKNKNRLVRRYIETV